MRPPSAPSPLLCSTQRPSSPQAEGAAQQQLRADAALHMCTQELLAERARSKALEQELHGRLMQLAALDVAGTKAGADGAQASGGRGGAAAVSQDQRLALAAAIGASIEDAAQRACDAQVWQERVRRLSEDVSAARDTAATERAARLRSERALHGRILQLQLVRRGLNTSDNPVWVRLEKELAECPWVARLGGLQRNCRPRAHATTQSRAPANKGSGSGCSRRAGAAGRRYRQRYRRCCRLRPPWQ